MKNVVRIVAATLLAVAAYTYVRPLVAQDDWLSTYKDAGNTSGAGAALPAELNILWEEPAGGGLPPYEAALPLFYTTPASHQFVISGTLVYEADNGTAVATLPNAGDRAVITKTLDAAGNPLDVLLAGRPSDPGPASGYQFFAYRLDLDNPDPDLKYQAIWELTADVPSQSVELNAKNGVFFISGDSGIAAVDAYNGNRLWLRTGFELGIYGYCMTPPACATLLQTGEDVVYNTSEGFGGTYYGGLAAINVADGIMRWHVTGIACDSVCCDEANGLVYAGMSSSTHSLRAYDALTGTREWSVPIDWILNGPPTLGTANGHPAVFVVTGNVGRSAGVYAIHQGRLGVGGGNVIWSKLSALPTDAWCSATYTGGKLYIAGNDGRAYVLDANTGERLQTLGTDVTFGVPSLRSLVIANIVRNGSTSAAMYYAAEDGSIVALNASGTPLPQVCTLSVSAQKNPIPINSSTFVYAKLTDGSGRPIVDTPVTFSTNVASTQGYVQPTAVSTDSSGIATTTFFSKKRTGWVTITSQALDASPQSITITVGKAPR